MGNCRLLPTLRSALTMRACPIATGGNILSVSYSSRGKIEYRAASHPAMRFVMSCFYHCQYFLQLKCPDLILLMAHPGRYQGHILGHKFMSGLTGFKSSPPGIVTRYEMSSNETIVRDGQGELVQSSERHLHNSLQVGELSKI